MCPRAMLVRSTNQHSSASCPASQGLQDQDSPKVEVSFLHVTVSSTFGQQQPAVLKTNKQTNKTPPPNIDYLSAT